MIRPALNFAKEIFRFNLIISTATAFLGGTAGNSRIGFIPGFFTVFSVSLFTGGFLFAVYFYILKYRKRFYFYYNLGLDKTRLIIAAWLFNLPIVFTLYIIALVINAL